MIHFLFLLRHSLCFFCFFFFTTCCGADLAQETIYLTWQQSPATTMTIQWISPTQNKDTTVYFRPLKGEGQWIKAAGGTFPFPHTSKYLIHRVELKDLQPNAEYLFKVLSYPEEYRFLTAPAYLEKELRFVVGGDMYHDGLSLLIKTCQRAAQTNPLFALVGGDIAYAVQSRIFSFEKIDRWIDWIKTWHSYMITPRGFLIPVIAAIGNHDLIGQFDQTPAQAAVFSALFPMPGKQIYNVLDFQNYLSIFILDSGHANPIAGQQSSWLKNVLQNRQQVTHRMAVYHVPAYPCVREFQNKCCTAIRNAWVPLFEEGKIQTVFEHHDHAYKRSYPLLKGRIHPQGILYLGDGGWGVETPRKFKEERFYLAKFLSARHFISVILTPLEQQFRCINDQGQILDEYHQSIKNEEKVFKKEEKVFRSPVVMQPVQ